MRFLPDVCQLRSRSNSLSSREIFLAENEKKARNAKNAANATNANNAENSKNANIAHNAKNAMNLEIAKAAKIAKTEIVSSFKTFKIWVFLKNRWVFRKDLDFLQIRFRWQNRCRMRIK